MTEKAATTNYEKMTVLQLRDLLKQRGLTTTGTKVGLLPFLGVLRLVNALLLC